MVGPQRLMGGLRTRSPRRGTADREGLHQVFRIIPVARLRTRRGRRQSVGGKQQSGVSSQQVSVKSGVSGQQVSVNATDAGYWLADYRLPNTTRAGLFC